MSADQFHLEGFDEAGNRFTATIAADSQEEAVRALALRGIRDVRVLRPSRERAAAQPMEIAQVCRELASMIDAGIALPDGLMEIAGGPARGRLGRALRAVAEETAKGVSLEEALARHGAPLGGALARLVRAGEAGGDLAGVLRQYATEREDQEELARDIRQSLFYPIVVLGLLVAVMAVAIAWMIPLLRETFFRVLGSRELAEQAIAEFAPVTWILAGVLALFVLGLLAWSALRLGRARRAPGTLRQRIASSLPVAGSLLEAVAHTRFYATLAMMIERGVGVPEALEISGAASGRPLTEMGATEAARRVRSGKSLSQALAAAECGGPWASWLVKGSERHGELTETLREISRLARENARRLASRIKILATPVCVAVVGAAIGVVAYGFFIALYRAFELAVR